MRIELTTSSLPRKCSTAELQQLNASLAVFKRAEDRARTGYPQLGRLTLYQMSYFRGLKLYFKELFFYSILTLLSKLTCGERRIRTFEVETTDLQSVPFGHSGISPTKTKKEPMEGFEPPTS